MCPPAAHSSSKKGGCSILTPLTSTIMSAQRFYKTLTETYLPDRSQQSLPMKWLFFPPRATGRTLCEFASPCFPFSFRGHHSSILIAAPLLFYPSFHLGIKILCTLPPIPLTAPPSKSETLTSVLSSSDLVDKIPSQGTSDVIATVDLTPRSQNSLLFF